MTKPAARDKVVQANGVDLCVETFGDPADPAILLIMGAVASMLFWDEEFCERLAAGPRFVIRYDHRDTGRSVSHEPGAPPYTLHDLAKDAVGLLDTFRLAKAHLVGMSMGGAVAQLAALDHPDRVASLTLIATSPAVPGSDDSDLPAMAEEVSAYFRAAVQPDWSDRAAVIDYMVEFERTCSGARGAFDEATMRDLAGCSFDRTVNIESSLTNHLVMDGGERWRERLAEVAAPRSSFTAPRIPCSPTAMRSRWRRRSQAPSYSPWSRQATSFLARPGMLSFPRFRGTRPAAEHR